MLKYMIDSNYYLKKIIYISFIQYKYQCKKNITCDGKKMNKSNFYKNKKLFNVCDIEVDKILISKQEPYGKKSSFKYFLGYSDDDYVMISLCIKLLQMIGYVKHFDSNKKVFLKVMIIDC